MINWWHWLTCPVCRAPAGLPCYARSGRVIAGQGDRAPVTLPRPHMLRQRSKAACPDRGGEHKPGIVRCKFCV